MRVCSTCGVETSASDSVCLGCGADLAKNVVFDVIHGRFRGSTPTVITNGVDPDTGDDVIRVYAPGAESETRTLDSGQLEIRIKGADGVGRTGEGRVAKALRQRLSTAGTTASIGPGRDDHGEDRILRVGGNEFVLQVVTAPPAPRFWREAKTTSASTQIDISRAAEWLHESIRHKTEKTPQAQRRKTVLAIDAQHAGFLASASVCREYLGAYGDPAGEWASVWVVGPITQYCARFGTGTP